MVHEQPFKELGFQMFLSENSPGQAVVAPKPCHSSSPLPWLCFQPLLGIGSMASALHILERARGEEVRLQHLAHSDQLVDKQVVVLSRSWVESAKAQLLEETLGSEGFGSAIFGVQALL